MARMLGAEACICVFKFLVEVTKRNIAREGASVIVVNGDYDMAAKQAMKASKEANGLLVEDTA